MKHRALASVIVGLLWVVYAGGQIPNQLAQDFVAGRAPTAAEVAQFEKDAAAKPGDLHLTRKLGKAYFFQFFGDGINTAAPKSEKTLNKALAIQNDDPETLAYLGALSVIQGQRVYDKGSAKQKAAYDRGFELIKKAESADPRNGAVMSIASATYIFLPDSYGMVPHVVEMLEGMIKGMGPYFQKFSHHGQQRILLTLGQAYARTGQPAKARAEFDEALKVDEASDEAIIIRKELKKLVAIAEKTR
jgi:tetratricopeptide (TPR) repeat protein